MMIHDQRLQELTKAYEDRHHWWGKMIARADAAKMQHFEAYRHAFIRQQEAESAALGFNRAAAISKKATREYAGNIASLYSTKRVFEMEVADPLRNINCTGKISRTKENFWSNYSEFLKDGRYMRVHDMLENAEGGRFMKWWHKLRYNKQDRAEWRKEIDAAKEYLNKHENTCIKLARVRNDISGGEKLIANGIYKMLRNKAVQEMLRTPMASGMAARSPELAFLTQYAARDFKVSKADIVRDLSAQEGKITHQRIYDVMENMSRRIGNSVNDRVNATLAARQRYEKAKSFGNSSRVTQRLETRTSMLVDGIHSDLQQSLKDSTHLTDDDKMELIRAAETKMRRWIKAPIAENNIGMLEKKDFDISNVKGMPWRGYAVNAGLDGIRRSVTEIPVRILKASVEFARNLFRHSWSDATTKTAPGAGTAATNVRQNTRTTQPPPPHNTKLTPS